MRKLCDVTEIYFLKMFFAEGSLKNKNTIREIRHDHLLDFSEESLFQGTDRTFSKVYAELPYPTHIQYKTSEDLVQKLLKDKVEYNNIQESIRKRYLRHDKKKIERKRYGSHKYMHLPQYLVNWCEKDDPDPTFNSDYNYYYTDGILDHFQHRNNDYLICRDIDNTLCVTNTLSDEDIHNDVIKVNMDYNSEDTINNINSTDTNDGLYFVIREKHKVNVVKFRDDFKVTLKYSKKHHQPLLDAKLCADGKLGLIYPNTKFSIKDITTDHTIVSFKSELSQETDTFQQFRFLEENTVLIMDRKKIRLIDLRSKAEEMCFEPEFLQCNSFYNFVTLDNTLITASRHYVLKTDFRSLDDVYHYSHSLSEAPCYLDYAKKDLDTYLIISGQHYDSRVLFTGKSPFSLPFKLPSLRDTLTEARLQYPSLVLDHHLEERLFHSISGLKVLNIDGTITIFMANCFGEIFKQKVFETEPNKSKPIGKFHEWSQTLEKPEPTLHLTHFEDISDIRFSLNEDYKSKNLYNYKVPGKGKQFLKKFDEKYSSKNIESQVAKDFLSLWEESDEDEYIDDLPKEEALDKVNNWIQSHDFKDEDQEDKTSVTC